MADESFGAPSRVISLGDHNLTIRVDDGSTVVDIADAPDPAATPELEWPDLLADVAPGLAIEPMLTGAPIIDLTDGVRVGFDAPSGTALSYGHVRLVLEGAHRLTLDVAGRSRVTMVGAATMVATADLGWLEAGRSFVEVYPNIGARRPFVVLGAAYPAAPGDEPRTLLEFDPLGNRPARYLVGATLTVDPWQGSLPMPILKSEVPAQQLDVMDLADAGMDAAAVAFALGITVDRLQPALRFQASELLDVAHLALGVDHRDGIELSSAAAPEFNFPTDPSGSPGPLAWKLTRPDAGPLLVLNTMNADHRLVLADGAHAELTYSGLSRDPIPFVVERFEITKKGIVADARVSDDPVVLNGVDTAFRFSEGVIQVRDGAVADFTLLGSGPLPPALIGDANADISIRFSDTPSGGIVPVGAGAALTNDQPIFSPDVLFEYSVDALGLAYAQDGDSFHFYFTMSGAATFSPGADFPATNALAELGVATLGLVEAPIAGDGSVLSQYIDFRIELPDPAGFAVLGCFEMQIQSVGFHPDYEPFDGDAGLELAGQVNFADGEGDKAVGVESRHRLVIGAPEPGGFVPRIHFVELSVVIEKGDAFKLDVVVNFYDSATESGFDGEGTLEIKGLPSLAVAVGFKRVVRTADGVWLRAWFIAANIGKLTLRVPYLEIYLREIGLGFGYRYTLASIAAADESDDIGDLLEELRELSRGQGDLATRDAWAISLEDPGEDARWTIALRALFSQAASPSSTPIRWNEAAEEKVPSAFLFDVVAAVRSDLTFFIAARAWLNTNYWDYVNDEDGAIRSAPLFTGFALLEPRKERFLAQIASNPEGHLGSRPPLPNFLETAIRNGQFAATVLIEPNLFHAELGWPNQLRWAANFGPVKVEYRGGLIYRIAHAAGTTDLVLGISYMARASLTFSAGVSIGVAGVDLTARADGAFGARLIAAAQLGGGSNTMQIYGGVGVDLRIRIELSVWIDFLFVTKRWTFAMEMQFTASLEFGILVPESKQPQVGVRGRGTLRIRVLGKSFEVRARIESNGSTVTAARAATAKYLAMGLEADEDASAAIPGSGGGTQGNVGGRAAAALGRSGGARDASPVLDPAEARADGVGAGPPETEPGPTEAVPTEPLPTDAVPTEPPPTEPPVIDPEPIGPPIVVPASTVEPEVPEYDVFVIRGADGPAYALVYPGGNRGFLPRPPVNGATQPDFALTQSGAGLERWDHTTAGFVAVDDDGWEVPWHASVIEADPDDLTLARYIEAAFVDGRDPVPLEVAREITDGRVKNPTDSAYESAVRGAFEQFRSSPLFKPDPNSLYETALRNALRPDTSIYPEVDEPDLQNSVEGARQLRGMIVEEMVADLRAFVAGDADFDPSTSPAFMMGLVVRAEPETGWLAGDGDETPWLAQRMGSAGLSDPQPLRVFNRAADDFAVRLPRLDDLRTFTDATTVAFSWDLAWPADETSEADDARNDPEEHLAHYEVTRRAVADGLDQMSTTVKPADVLGAADPADPFSVASLRPRFQFVDHFGHESAEEIAALPEAGKAYIYTITPVDVNGSRGRAVTVVATRFPNEPPPVPVDTEVTVGYALDGASFDPHPDTVPPPVEPDTITATWTRPAHDSTAPEVAIASFRLVFRRLETMAVGSYGLDAATAGDLPSSHARVRPDDVFVDLDPGEPDLAGVHTAGISADDLRAVGVLPEHEWQPDGWRVFMQTISAADVPSALVPVKLRLEFTGPAIAEDRYPSHLEWITPSLDLPVLPARDGAAKAIDVHVPQPDESSVTDVAFLPHPSGVRAVQLRWNQVPSDGGAAAYPTAMSAGYQIFRLDVDAHSRETFNDPDLLAAAVERLDEVRLQPPDTLGRVPNTTTNTTEWDAWYRAPAVASSWSSHRLRWPIRTTQNLILDTVIANTDRADVVERIANTPALLHPALRLLLACTDPRYIVDAQAGRPLTARREDGPVTLDDIVRATPASSDPHGWALLQHLGLSVTISFRDTVSGEIVDGSTVAEVVRGAIDTARGVVAESVMHLDESPPWMRSLTFDDLGGSHLVFELLFTPESARRGSPGPIAPDDLLSMIQVSLRPFPVPIPAEGADDAVLTELRTFATNLADIAENSGSALQQMHGTETARYEAWLDRFMQHGTTPIAAAYPRASAPATATPDASGRVGYLDVITDGWAHAYRYYVKPYGRYDRLWASLAGDAFADVARTSRMRRPIDLPAIDPDAGGIDAVVERTAPIAPPVVVNSARIDPAAEPGAAPEPGHTWEIAIAAHPEQVLSERNLTLRRRLDYRQVAFTVMRRFVADTDSIEAVDIDLADIDLAPDVTQEIPTSMALEHVDADSSDPLVRASLAIPSRTGGFGSGAMVVQIDHLPFYYQHRLIAVAQTSALVSEAADIVQPEFGYRSPVPTASMHVAFGDWASAPLDRVVVVPLARLWDALTGDQQLRWPGEVPDGAVRRPGAIPDPEVSYDILYAVNGTVTVVARIYFDRPESGPARWEVAPVGDSFPVRRIGRIMAGGDSSDRDRAVTVAIGRRSGMESSEPLRMPISFLATFHGEGSRTETDPPERWHVARFGVGAVDVADLRVSPALRAAINRVALLVDGEELVTTMLDATRPVPTLDGLVGDIDESDATAYSSFHWGSHPDAAAVSTLRDVLESGSLPSDMQDALAQLRDRTDDLAAPIELELGPSFEDMFEPGTFNRPTPDRLVWSGHPGVFQNRASTGHRLEHADEVMAHAVESFLADLHSRVPGELVELWGDDGLDSTLAAAAGDTGIAMMKAFAGAPAAMFEYAMPLVTDEMKQVLVDVARGSDVDIGEPEATQRPDAAFLAESTGERLTISDARWVANDDGTLSLTPGLYRWSGLADREGVTFVESLMGDRPFDQVNGEMASMLRSRMDTVITTDTGLGIPVASGLESSPSAARILASPYVVVQRGFLAYDDAAGVHADGTEVDRLAIDLLYRRSLVHDLACGSFQLRTRRGSAAPSDRTRVLTRDLDQEATHG